MFGTSSSSQKKLKGKKIAVLATDGFEQSEVFEPKKVLETAGADVKIVSLRGGSIFAWDKTNWGKSIAVDYLVTNCSSEDFDALVIPGGIMNPDKLRANKNAIDFVREFVDEGKPIAAICHGPQLLIETNALRDRNVTSWPSIKTDLINAGAHWEDSEVVVDDGLITSRQPADLPAFNKKIVEEFYVGRHFPNPKRAIPLGAVPRHH